MMFNPPDDPSDFSLNCRVDVSKSHHDNHNFETAPGSVLDDLQVPDQIRKNRNRVW